MSSFTDLADRAVAILCGQRFLVLSTCDASGMPWAATVNHVVSDCGALLFCSSPNALHSQHIAEQPVVAATAYHLDPDPDSIDSVQLRGICAPAAREDLPRLHTEFFVKDFPEPAVRAAMTIPMARFEAGGTHQLYTIAITECWVRDHQAWRDDQIDRRVSVSIKSLVARLNAITASTQGS